VTDRAAAITKARVVEATCPVASVSCTVILYVPAVEGVPEIVPEIVPRPTPAGNWPERIDQV